MRPDENICVMCFYTMIKIMMEQAFEVYCNLQSILLLQESRPTDKIVAEKVNGGKFYSSDTVKNLEDFLNEGKKYLNLANSFDEYNRQDSTIFGIMLKALDIYSKLKFQFLSFIFDENDGDDEESYDGRFHSTDDISDEDILLDIVFHDKLEEIIENKLYYEMMLVKIQLLITRIQNVHLAFNRNRLSFNLILMDYCKRLKLFLSNDAEIVKYNKLEKGQMQDIYCKYNRLKELLECIIEVGSRNEDAILNMI